MSDPSQLQITILLLNNIYYISLFNSTIILKDIIGYSLYNSNQIKVKDNYILQANNLNIDYTIDNNYNTMTIDSIFLVLTDIDSSKNIRYISKDPKSNVTKSDFESGLQLSLEMA